jgi:GxxExxY protein
MLSSTTNSVGHEPIPDELEEAGKKLLGAAIEVHRLLGPGLLESVYEQAFAHECGLRGLEILRQVPVVVNYKDLVIEGQRLDVYVEPGIIVELKAVEQLLAIHEAQLISYLKSKKCRLGFLINFNVGLLKNGGIKRIVN